MQIINLLQKLGWKPFSAARPVNPSSIILQDVLEKWLQKVNSFEYKGSKHKFSRNNIQKAVLAIKDITVEGGVSSNERIYDLLTLGKTFSEVIHGDQKAFTLKFIDWVNPRRNVFHLAHTFDQETEHSRPDIVLYVNGIPVVVMIISAGGRPETENRISLHLYSAGASGLRVVHCAQWLLAIQLDNDRVFYNAPGTVHWSEWQEDNKRRCESVLKSTMFDGVGEDRPVTNMDSSLVGMFERKRFLDLIYKFMFYDGLHTSIVRYQQFDAIQASLRRIEKKDKAGKHLGGTIWYKSGDYVDLTIAMLAKAIRLQPYKISPLVFIATDRIEIIPIIQKAFLNCGQVVRQARTGNDLIALLKDQDNRNIVSTFDKILKMTKAKSLIDSAEIFVLIDDAQSYSLASVVTKIRSTLPQACIINFTASPEAEKEDGTTRVPSDIIHQYALEESSLLIVQEAPMQYRLTHEEAVRLFKDDISKILSGSLSGSKNRVSQALEKITARIANKIQPFITRDWKNDPDKTLTLENAIEEVMMSCNESGIRIVFDDFDAILKECVGAARARL